MAFVSPSPLRFQLRNIFFTFFRRYERHFAPNVSLAPVQKKEEEDEEFESLKSRVPYKPHFTGSQSHHHHHHHHQPHHSVSHSTSVEDNLDIDVLSDTESSLKSSDSSGTFLRTSPFMNVRLPCHKH